MAGDVSANQIAPFARTFWFAVLGAKSILVVPPRAARSALEFWCVYGDFVELVTILIF